MKMDHCQYHMFLKCLSIFIFNGYKTTQTVCLLCCTLSWTGQVKTNRVTNNAKYHNIHFLRKTAQALKVPMETPSKMDFACFVISRAYQKSTYLSIIYSFIETLPNYAQLFCYYRNMKKSGNASPCRYNLTLSSVRIFCGNLQALTEIS